MTTRCRNCPLRSLKIFAPMSAQDVEAMQRFKVGELVVEPGTQLLMEGSNSPQLFTALSGQGIRYKTLANGRRQVINFIFPGDLLGLQAAVMAEMQHSAEATTDMVLCVFDRSEFFNIVRSHSERAYDMIWASAVEEHFLGEELATLGQRKAIERVAWSIARIWNRLTALGLEQNGTVPLPHRQQDLADAMGLSLVHTNKTLAKLRSRQIAHWNDGTLSVSDWATLLKLAHLAPNVSAPVRPLF